MKKSGRSYCALMDCIMHAYENDNQRVAYFGVYNSHTRTLIRMALDLIIIHILPIKRIEITEAKGKARIFFLNGSQLIIKKYKSDIDIQFDYFDKYDIDHYYWDIDAFEYRT